MTSSLKNTKAEINPYLAKAGEGTDEFLYLELFGGAPVPHPPPFSEEDGAAGLLKKKIETVYKGRVVTGKTRTRPAMFFARLDDDPSTSTEALAETYPLALARLAMVLLKRRAAP